MGKRLWRPAGDLPAPEPLDSEGQLFLVRYTLTLRRLEKRIIGARAVEAFCSVELERLSDYRGLTLEGREIHYTWHDGGITAWAYAGPCDAD